MLLKISIKVRLGFGGGYPCTIISPSVDLLVEQKGPPEEVGVPQPAEPLFLLL